MMMTNCNIIVAITMLLKYLLSNIFILESYDVERKGINFVKVVTYPPDPWALWR